MQPGGRPRYLYVLALCALVLAGALAANTLGRFGSTNSAATSAVVTGPGINAPSGSTGNVAGQVNAKTVAVKTLPNGVTVSPEVHHDLSQPLTSYPIQHSDGSVKQAPENPEKTIPLAKSLEDTVVQRFFGGFNMPAPILSYNGINSATSGCGCLPPDTNGEVGPNNFVQTVNTSFQIYDKSGNSLFGPARVNTLFTGFGGLCQTTNDGDPVVNYDQLADRWVISQFAFTNFPGPGPFDQCVAVSTTGNPMGTYYRYDFQISQTLFDDYPKVSVWPDGYYVTFNLFDQTGSFSNPLDVALDRSRMLQGQTATMQAVNPGNFYADLLPGDLDGTTPPPAGAPNPLLSVSGNNTLLHLWKYHVDWMNPANTQLIGPTNLAAAPWDPDLCGGSRNCIPQPSPGVAVDSLGDHAMFRLAYRNFGDHDALVASESVDENHMDHSGIRWYEIRNYNTAPAIYQQSTYAPDASDRWMPSIAMDGAGDIAVGYSVSSSTVFPSVRYAGRLVGDPLNMLSQGEATLIAGTGAQTSTSGRWGDYSDMTVDPTDDCTFWYTQEYYSTTSNAGWNTRIGNFKFPSCAATVPSATPTMQTATGTPATATNTATQIAATQTATGQATPSATPNTCLVYTSSSTPGGGTIVPGTVDIGNHCDDCSTYITMPFALNLYNQSFTNAYVSSNGVLEFGTSDFAYGNACLPVPIFNYAVMPYWTDLITNGATGLGVFTSTTGSAPNRIYNVEWRAQELGQTNVAVNFEVQFYENSSQVNLVYGTNIGFGGNSATIGIQRDLSDFTQVSCNTVGSVTPNLLITLNLPPCATATATASSVATGQASTTSTTQPGASMTSTTQPGASSTTTVQPVASATATSTVQPTACPLQFTDVPSMGSGSTFYSFVRCLVCRGIVSGYPCGGVNPATGGAEPCDNNQHGYYRPGNNVSRGQLSKIIANAAGLNSPIPTGQQSFSDVPPSSSPSSFYVYIERLASTGAIAGYPCNTTNPQTGQFLPCDNANRPYFLPTNSATRGQISKIVALAAGYQDILPTGQQTFTDVPPNSPFYQYIEELASRHIIDGYDAASGRCEAHNPPYAAPCFLYNDFTTRGQMAKIAANAFFPNCQTPTEAVKR